MWLVGLGGFEGGDVLDERVMALPEGVGAGMADLSAAAGGGVVLGFAVGFQAGPQAFGEGGQGVAVPVFEGVAGEGEQGGAALVG